MSRIGKIPVDIPEKVKVNVKDQHIDVEGPKGKLSWDFPSRASVAVNENQVVVSRANDEKESNTNQPDDKLCIICDKKFETAIDLNFHSIHHLIENKSLCNFCGVQCSNIDEMLQHTVMTHVSESVEFIKKQITN